MLEILFLAVVILAILLKDTRRRVADIRSQLDQLKMEAGGHQQSAAAPIFASPVVAEPAVPAGPASAGPSSVGPSSPDEHSDAAALADLDRSVDEDRTVEALSPSTPISSLWSAAPTPAPLHPEPDLPQSAAGRAETPEAASRPARFGFEDLFGRKLPIWLGGATLIVAGFLIVKYSIDAGLLAPAVRAVIAILFGILLIGGAEFARRKRDRVRDERIAQALAGAGVGTLYAAVLGASELYHLIGPGMAFAGLSMVTALALGLAMRFGAPCAVLGLVGGMATPAIIDSDASSIPLLCAYLLLVVGALIGLSRRQRWFWLAGCALLGGGGWVAMIMPDPMSIVSRPGDTLAIGLMVVLLGLAAPVFLPEDRRRGAVRTGAAVIASLELAALMVGGGFAPLTWGLYALLSLAFLWLAAREPGLRRVVPVPLGTALVLMGLWPDPGAAMFAAVTIGLIIIYGGCALHRITRPSESRMQAGQLIAVAVAGQVLSVWKFYAFAPGQDSVFALMALGFAALPMLGALRLHRESAGKGGAFAALCAATGYLLCLCAGFALPEWTIPVALSAVTAGLLLVGRCERNRFLPLLASVFLVCAAVTLWVTGDRAEIPTLYGCGDILGWPSLSAILRWASAFVAAVGTFYCLTALNRDPVTGRAGGWTRWTGQGAGALAAILGYGLVAQIVPSSMLPTVAALMLAVLSFYHRRRVDGDAEAEAKNGFDISASAVTLVAIVTAWALPPFSQWLFAGVRSLGGVPLLVNAVPEPWEALRALLIPGLVVVPCCWWLKPGARSSRWMALACLAFAMVVAGGHSLYKQLFAIADLEAFHHLGLAERTLWEAVLALVAWTLFIRLGAKRMALVLLGMAMAHWVVYSLLLFDPLLTLQSVGPWPIVNLLAPGLVLALGLPMLALRIEPALKPALTRPVSVWTMVMIPLFAFANWRQLFAGAWISGWDISAPESIGWSVITIALAIAYLVHGIRARARDWRIASLLLMLMAVMKVFLLDASGLTGLLRIAAFIALGFSLIGIGWLYSRYLRSDEVA